MAVVCNSWQHLFVPPLHSGVAQLLFLMFIIHIILPTTSIENAENHLEHNLCITSNHRSRTTTTIDQPPPTAPPNPHPLCLPPVVVNRPPHTSIITSLNGQSWPERILRNFDLRLPKRNKPISDLVFFFPFFFF